MVMSGTVSAGTSPTKKIIENTIPKNIKST